MLALIVAVDNTVPSGDRGQVIPFPSAIDSDQSDRQPAGRPKALLFTRHVLQARPFLHRLLARWCFISRGECKIHGEPKQLERKRTSSLVSVLSPLQFLRWSPLLHVARYLPCLKYIPNEWRSVREIHLI